MNTKVTNPHLSGEPDSSVPRLTTINAAWSVLPEEDGTIGVLYDPDELANLLEYVDPDTPADMDALTAWCKQEADYLRDAMSNVIYSNLPSRSEIYAALAKQTPK